jgi:hypothetical protein
MKEIATGISLIYYLQTGSGQNLLLSQAAARMTQSAGQKDATIVMPAIQWGIRVSLMPAPSRKASIGNQSFGCSMILPAIAAMRSPW